MQEIIKAWKQHPLYADTLASLSEEELYDRFYQLVPFGTAGMRGVMDAGLNRINIHTIRLAAYGLAKTVQAQGTDAMAQGVVITYDTRHNSREYALETAGVLVKQGIHTYVFAESRPTPELSFAVRYLKAKAGVVITASHNPKQYNGFKVYGEDGAQLTPVYADEIKRHMQTQHDIFAIETLTYDELNQSSLFVEVLEQIDKPYFEHVVQAFSSKPTEEKANYQIVYTPLHGSGKYPVQTILKTSGFQSIHYVKEQMVQDGEFPTVSYPNPEEKDAFKLTMELGKEQNAQLLLATDPDADRLGVAVWHEGNYRLLNGNQLGALVLHYILSTKEIPANAAAVKTIVTSNLGTAIANHFGVTMHETLTGFKYIAEKIANWEQTGEHTYMFGYEESYGYLAGTFVRDKDAVQMALLVAEMAAHFASQGRNLVQQLEEIHKQFGYYKEALISKNFEGAAGAVQMANMLDDLRANLPAQIGQSKVTKVEDYLHQNVKDLPKENVVKFYLEDESWLCIRPSGTEPKCKFYCSVRGESYEDAEQKIAQLTDYIYDLIQ